MDFEFSMYRRLLYVLCNLAESSFCDLSSMYFISGRREVVDNINKAFLYFMCLGYVYG